MYTEEVNKIALSSNDDKRIQTYDKITTDPYGTNAFKVCENEMLLKKNKVTSENDYISLHNNYSKKLISNIDKISQLKDRVKRI